MTGELEMWVRVLSDEVVDWADVRAALTPDQLELLGDFRQQAPKNYYPDNGTDRAERGSYVFEDYWVLSAVPSAMRREPRVVFPAVLASYAMVLNAMGHLNLMVTF